MILSRIPPKSKGFLQDCFHFFIGGFLFLILLFHSEGKDLAVAPNGNNFIRVGGVFAAVAPDLVEFLP